MAINCRVSVQIRGGLTYGLGSVLANPSRNSPVSLYLVTRLYGVMALTTYDFVARSTKVGKGRLAFEVLKGYITR